MSGNLKHTYIYTSVTFVVSKMGLSTLRAQPVSILRFKLWKIIMKYEKAMFCNFWSNLSHNVHI